jgi:6-pyruvoyltetrahydropterin/6-carboxytetrahydropterin synthase
VAEPGWREALVANQMYRSLKTYTHAQGLSACFRQWKAHSHCNQLHGYALQVEIVFRAVQLDDRGWVVDFGGMTEVKEWLEDTFDHKLLVAEDDPKFHNLMSIGYEGLADIIVLPRVGCEAFAKHVYDHVQLWLLGESKDGRVTVESVTIREHGGNAAQYSE